MTSTVSFDRRALPAAELDTTRPQGRGRADPGARALRFAAVPLLISVAVNATFLVAWWLPEYGRFPGHEALLTQLSPLASKELTSQAAAVVPAQADRSGLIAAILLVAAVPLPFAARSRRWAVRLVVPTAIAYLGAIGWLITLLGLLSRSQARASLVGLLLLTGWVAAAGLTVWRGLRVQAEELPSRPTRVLWLLAAVAVIHPLPLALGRRLFAPELTAAARSLAGSEPALRLAALNTAATLPLYLAGICLAGVVWAGYMLAPPIRPVRVPWVPRRRSVSGTRTSAVTEPLSVRLALLTCWVLGVIMFGAVGSREGATRAAELRVGSPAADLPLSCASWTAERGGQPVQTLVASGRGCSTLTSYRGFRRLSERELSAELSPLRARTPEGARITSRVVGARYGPVVVLAATSRFGSAPDQLLGVSLADARLLWSFRCDDDRGMGVRFAGADGGDRPDDGRRTDIGEPASVRVACTNQPLVMSPRTGRPLGS